MIHQPYSDVRALTGLLRRLLADEVPIADVPAKVTSMDASGEIELVKKPYPPTDWWWAALRQSDRLPFEWWLVKLPDGRLSIETDNPDHPLDPNHILYRERLPQPPTPVAVVEPATIAPATVIGKELLEAKRQQGTLEPDITEWLLKDMTSSTAAGKPFLYADAGLYYAECKEKFPGVHYRELDRSLTAAREYLSLVKPRTPSKQKKPKRQPKQS